jgi:predicted GNAT family acetyltransferase
MKLTIEDNPEESRFEIYHGDDRVGLVQYRRAPDRISFLHTETDPAVQGLGVGSELVAHALSEAQANGLMVLPFCPFVRRYIAENIEYRVLVPVDQLSAFGLAE